MSTVSHKIKLTGTVTAEYFPVEVDGGVAEHNRLIQCFKSTGVVYNRVVIQELLIIKLSSILVFPHSSHLQD